MKSLLENLDLMAFNINFNFEKKAVYHSFFGILISMCIYSFLIVLTQYFAKDFYNKSNPRVIYQETEFIENFTIPINFFLKEHSYSIHSQTKENLLNLSKTEQEKDLKNQTNNYFTLDFIIKYNQKIYMEIKLIDQIDISSKKTKDKNGEEIFSNSIYSNQNSIDKKLDLYIYNYRNGNETYAKGISYNNFNITIEPEMTIVLNIKKKGSSIL